MADVRNNWAKNATTGGYPEGEGSYEYPGEKELGISDHFRLQTTAPKSTFITPKTAQEDDSSYLVKDKRQHFTRDWNDPDKKSYSHPINYPDGEGGVVPVFSGATTDVNQFDNQAKQAIITKGLEATEIGRVSEAEQSVDAIPPISPMHPFTRMYSPTDAQLANLVAYNRTKLPIADLEFRKGFRHVFFSRPECYVMTNQGGVRLCQQAEFDEDFSSSYSRLPHITKMLAPVYVTQTFGRSGLDNDNWNYLLSNRCLGLSVSGATLSMRENVTKSIEGYCVMPGMHYDGRQGSTISVSFRDTKYLEIYEYFRLWMLYIWKRTKGIFAPSYNRYQYKNGFEKAGKLSTADVLANFCHPYDRALDYTCSMFDVITNETGSNMIHWCKYYGMYPTELSIEGLSNDNNAPIAGEMKVNVTFRYQYKVENINKSLVEFNYNAGICDHVGGMVNEVKVSHPFLLKNDPEDIVMPAYLGAAGMFAGTPYIVMVRTGHDPITRQPTATPALRFAPLTDESLDRKINLGITNTDDNTESMVETVKFANPVTDSGGGGETEESKSMNPLAEAIQGVVDEANDSKLMHIIDDYFY